MRSLCYKVLGFGALMTLAASAFAQPANDLCDNAIDISAEPFPYRSEAVSVLDAAFDLESRMSCVTASYSVWYKFVAGVSGAATVSTCAGDAPECTISDTALSVYISDDGTCGTLTSVGCNDDYCGLRSTVTCNMAAGSTYYIQVAKYGTTAPTGGADVLQMYMIAPTPPPPDRWLESGDAPDSIADAQMPSGSGTLGSIAGSLSGTADADLYLITICDPGSFSATTVGGTTFDSQLFLFSLDGSPVTFNDDDPSGTTLQSRISNIFVTDATDYYIAVAAYDHDPISADGLEFWLDQPFRAERQPDGPGVGGTLDSWTGNGGTDGATYLLTMTGVCFPGGGGACPSCPADYDLSGGVDGSDVEAFFTDWSNSAPCADTNLDGGIDGSDIETFFRAWENGGC